MTESALSDEADALYRALEDVSVWTAVAIPPVRTLHEPGDMAVHGAFLAAAHESAALDGVIPPDPDRARALLRGARTLSGLAEDERAHVKANYDALRLAVATGDDDLRSEPFLRRLHDVACRPQLTHPVRGEHGVHDHVLATGDFKHHPNHEPAAGGGWVAHAPVARLRDEMTGLFASLTGPPFAALHPFARAAYLLHAVTHVAPFADGNGRVARALAGACMWPVTGLPFVVFTDGPVAPVDDAEALVRFVADRCAALTDLLVALPPEAAAVDDWRARSAAGRALEDLLPEAVDGALTRHRARSDLGFLSPLSEVAVSGPPMTIAVPSAGVAEVLAVDAHPVLDDEVVVLSAREAQLRLALRPEEVAPDIAFRLDPWLDRVVSVLALRVAAELE